MSVLFKKIQFLLLSNILMTFAWSSEREELTYSDPYATHQHVLKELILKTEGPIIEFGCGNSSTDLLHALCKKTSRILITLDDDKQWLDRFKLKYLGEGYEKDNSGWHKFFFVPGKKDNGSPDHWIQFFENCEYINSQEYSICFVDQSPWLARYETIKIFKHTSEYVLLHDCNYFPEKNVFGKVIHPLDRKNHIKGVFDFGDEFPFFKVYYPDHPWPGDTGPPTLVGSMSKSEFPEF
ncbi:MAG: hypothetical protein K9M07_05175 [Simkaniaceae bacterium]|nr:hypothetical protein [Simkaniaceae bacterium]